jgi:hypothetical protein
MAENPKVRRPRDPSQLAKLMVEIAAGETDDRLMTDDGKDLAAVLLGRRGGLKGGRARAEALTASQRKEIAQKAALKRWGK